MEFLTIPKLFASTFYAIPDYQRDYEWTDVQNATLLDDVYALFEESEGNHFFGAIVTIPYDKNNGSDKSIDFEKYRITDENVKHVVDGQQRLTSFSLLAKALCDIIESNFGEDKSYVKSQSKKLEQIYLSNYFDGDNPAPYLILNGNTGKCFNREILNVAEQKYNKSFKSAKRILDAYEFFKEEILRKCRIKCGEDLLQQKNFYRDLVETILNKVTIVEISCAKSADAFQVFDSLNGKGLDLTAADRIKNIFMSWAPAKTRKQLWENFAQKMEESHLASFFVASFFYNSKKRVSKNRLPDEFNRLYKIEALKNFDEFNQSLCERAEIYGKIRMCSTENTNLNAVLRDLKYLKMEQIYVMLFAAVQKYGINVVLQKEFVDFAQVLTRLVVRMQVCERNMNRLDVRFSDWIGLMQSSNVTIADVTKKITEDIKQIVPDQNFLQSFAEFAPSDNKISEYYLVQIEEFLRRSEKKDRNPASGKGLSVEHIIPKACSFTEWYGNEEVPADVIDNFKSGVIEHIGNKLLLYTDDNTSAKNNNYARKLMVYRQGKKDQDQGNPYETFMLVKKLVDEYKDKFTHEQVRDRAKKLAEIAVQIW